MNYEPIVAGTQFSSFADPKSSNDDGSKPSSNDVKKVDEDPRKENEYEAVHKKLGDSLVMATNIASSLEAEQDCEMFDKAFKRVNAFEDFRTESVEGKEKRSRTELEQEITKKQKVEDDKEKAELKQLMETILDDKEVAIDAIPLAVKSPRIIDWKIYK
nr:hypothetical protein [Tanacetum cinerariifolium]